jgi:hypothetical protein
MAFAFASMASVGDGLILFALSDIMTHSLYLILNQQCITLSQEAFYHNKGGTTISVYCYGY